MVARLNNRRHRKIILLFLIITFGFIWPIFTDQAAMAEIQKILDKDNSEFILTLYNLENEGNFRGHDPGGIT